MAVRHDPHGADLPEYPERDIGYDDESHPGPDRDGVAALHDLEAEVGDDGEPQDLFLLDRRAAREAGVDLDPLGEEPVID